MTSTPRDEISFKIGFLNNNHNCYVAVYMSFMMAPHLAATAATTARGSLGNLLCSCSGERASKCVNI